MSTAAFKWIPVILLSLACHAPGAFAQQAPGAAERVHANAVASFRQACFSEAYGRFTALGDAGHAPSAALALWMYLNGPTLFGKDWDVSQEQLTAWAQLAGQPVPILVGRLYPQTPATPSRSRRPCTLTCAIAQPVAGTVAQEPSGPFPFVATRGLHGVLRWLHWVWPCQRPTTSSGPLIDLAGWRQAKGR